MGRTRGHLLHLLTSGAFILLGRGSPKAKDSSTWKHKRLTGYLPPSLCKADTPETPQPAVIDTNVQSGLGSWAGWRKDPDKSCGASAGKRQLPRAADPLLLLFTPTAPLWAGGLRGYPQSPSSEQPY